MSLADFISPISSGKLGMRQGTIKTPFNTTSVPNTVYLSVAGQLIPEVPYFSWYAPTVNDLVWVLTNGTDWMIIGKLAGT